MENNKSHLTGIIGGLIGGFIATIPWVLIYVYGNMILSALAIIIAIGVLKGYQLLKGKVDNKLPIIITVISLLCVTVATLVIIPMLLIIKEGGDASKINMLYQNGEFVAAIMKDYVISFIFTILGISGVIANVKKQIREGKTSIDIKLNNNQNMEEIKKLQEICNKLGATSKNTAISLETLTNELNDPFAKDTINQAMSLGYLHKHKGNYYYTEKKNNPGASVVVIIIILAFVIGLICVIAGGSDTTAYDDQLVTNQFNSFTVDGNWVESTDWQDDEGKYYVRRNDPDAQKGHLYVANYNFDETITNEKDYINEMTNYYKTTEDINYGYDKQYELDGKQVYEYYWDFENDYGVKVYETVYIVFNENNFIMLDNIHDKKDIYEDQKELNTKIIKSLEWK